MEDISEKQVYKSGFVAVMGRPNVGKSTLINALLGQKVAAVTPRPQTTRKRQMGILSLENAQIVFIDTPGIHDPRHKLGNNMNEEAIDALKGSDALLWVVDISQPPHEDELLIAGHLRNLSGHGAVILALNKVDLAHKDTQANHQEAYLNIAPTAYPVMISSTREKNLDTLINLIIEHLAEGFPFYPEDQITDLYEREITADLIREACLILLRDEIPHGIAVRIDEFTERENHGAYIEATIFVEKDSHKPIVIGKGGRMLKVIGTRARTEIEAMSGRKVFLRLRVKVRKNWRNDEKILRRFGF